MVTKLTNGYKLNINKKNAMVFHMPQKQIQLPKLSLSQTSIEFVSNFNFLGITIDTHLNWASHINLITNKVRKIAGILNKLKRILPQSVLVTIYYSLIQCHFNYGILAWGQQTQRLYNLQKRITRTITCSPFISHSAPLLKKLEILNINDVYKIQQLKF